MSEIRGDSRTLDGNRLITYGPKKSSDIGLKVARKHLKSVDGKRNTTSYTYSQSW